MVAAVLICHQETKQRSPWISAAGWQVGAGQVVVTPLHDGTMELSSGLQEAELVLSSQLRCAAPLLLSAPSPGIMQSGSIYQPWTVEPEVELCRRLVNDTATGVKPWSQIPV